MNAPPAQPNQSLQEGIEVLLALVQRGESVGVRELARELDMTPTRLQRYVATLAHLGLAAQGSDRRYSVGPGIHTLSAMSLRASGLASRAMEILPSLNDLGAKVALGVVWRKTVSYLYFSHPGKPEFMALGHEDKFPAQNSVIGLVLLADVPETQVKQEYPDDFPRLRKQLCALRRDGYARIVRSATETSLGVAVGSPAFAGLALSGSFRPEQEPQLIQRLQSAALSVATRRNENEHSK
jgi:DNA-binding IclR family transcriptional regulator